MFRFFLVIVSCSLFFEAFGCRDELVSPFPVGELYTGAVNHKEDTKGFHPNFAREYYNAKTVNFSGHYVLFTFGSGGGSLGFGLLNAKTGTLVANEVPNYIVDDYEYSEYSIESSSLTIQGRTVEDDIVTVKSFAFKDGVLKLIRTENVGSGQ